MANAKDRLITLLATSTDMNPFEAAQFIRLLLEVIEDEWQGLTMEEHYAIMEDIGGTL
jgi:hypothetical protein